MFMIMNDEYAHPDHNIGYIGENIPGPTENTPEYRTIVDEFESQISICCTCIPMCLEGTCLCIRYSGGINYRANLIVKRSVDVQPIVECNSVCKCSTSCNNRLVQNGPIGNLIVRNIGVKGLGLFTTMLIPKGSFVCEYAGEVITKAEAHRRHSWNLKSGSMNYVFCLNEHSNGLITQTIIDPSKFGNIGRYINHSCEPNCEIIPVRVDTHVPKLAIFSNSDIVPDSEITFDYGSHSIQSMFLDENQRKKCLCGSHNCRGYLPCEDY